MSDKTNIAWCDSTFNPWIGCTKVSPACDHCYAERDFDLRRHVVEWGQGKRRHLTSEANWKLPLRWNAKPFYECPHCGWRGDTPGRVGSMIGCPNLDCPSGSVRLTRRRVFCASLADVFDNEVNPAWRADLFDLISATPNLDWLLLTKRIGNAKTMMEIACTPWRISGGAWPIPNVLIGATICNQAEADRDIPKLLSVPAKVRFLSIEPMLGPISFEGMWVEHENPAIHENMLEALDWIICGGESGKDARPMHPEWVRQLRDQCAVAGVPFFFKQWGEWGDPDSIEATGTAHNGWWEDCREDGGVQRHTFDINNEVFRAGNKHTGRFLDGRKHNEFPESKA